MTDEAVGVSVTANRPHRGLQNVLAILIVALGGFAIMVLEIIGARFLAKDFGSSFYVWVSQIGVIMIALALGYYIGGALADRFQRVAFLAILLLPAGVATLLIPEFSPPVIEAVIGRHPAGSAIPAIWQKLDPAIGSGLIFLLPCFALATLPPYMIRVASRRLTHVGRISGLIIAASTVGSIVGVFFAGYVLIDHLRMSVIFRLTGVLIACLALLCLGADRWLRDEADDDKPSQ